MFSVTKRLKIYRVGRLEKKKDFFKKCMFYVELEFEGEKKM